MPVRSIRVSVRRAAPLLLLLSAACASTAMVNMWKDPVYPQHPLMNVLVVTLRKDPVSRRIWEDGFVSALRASGVRATASYTLFPTALPDTGALIDSVRARGYDAMLIAHLVSASTITQWVPGYVMAQPRWYPGPWRAHYALYWGALYAPGYLETDRVVRYETDMWMTEGAGRLVWSGTTASINPTSARDVNREIADIIAPELLRQRVTAGP